MDASRWCTYGKYQWTCGDNGIVPIMECKVEWCSQCGMRTRLTNEFILLVVDSDHETTVRISKYFIVNDG